MHYKDGTPAKIGDVVKGPHPNGHSDSAVRRTLIGQVVTTHPGSDTCNLYVQPALTIVDHDGLRVTTPLEQYPLTCTAGEFEKVV